MYQRKVDVDMLNAVKSFLADVSSISPSSEQRRLRAKARNISQQTLYGVQHIHINLTLVRLDRGAIKDTIVEITIKKYVK